MTSGEPELELARFIRDFRRYSKESLDNGTVNTILMYRVDCGACHQQFRHFKNWFKVCFAKTKNLNKMRESQKMCRIFNRIYIIERNSAEAKKFLDKTGFKMEASPAWFDYPSGQFLQYGLLEANALKIVTRSGHE